MVTMFKRYRCFKTAKGVEKGVDFLPPKKFNRNKRLCVVQKNVHPQIHPPKGLGISISYLIFETKGKDFERKRQKQALYNTQNLLPLPPPIPLSPNIHILIYYHYRKKGVEKGVEKGVDFSQKTYGPRRCRASSSTPYFGGIKWQGK